MAHVLETSAQTPSALLNADTTKPYKITTYPILGYTPETRLAYGAAAMLLYSPDTFKNKSTRITTINPFVVFTQNKQLKAVLLADIFHKNSFYSLRGEGSIFPQYYYGLGNQTPNTRERYTLRGFGIFFKHLNNTHKDFQPGYVFSLLQSRITDIDIEGVLKEDPVFGVEKHMLISAGPALRIERRDDILYPQEGWYAESSLAYFTDLGDSQYSFFETKFEARSYFSTKDRLNTLAFMLHSSYFSNKQVPFYLLHKSAGEKRLRGINSFRYTDQANLYFLTEYRRLLPWGFGLNLFGGTGDVAPGYAHFKLNEFKLVYGAGIRFNILPGKRYHFRFDWAWSNKKTDGFYIGIGEFF